MKTNFENLELKDLLKRTDPLHQTDEYINTWLSIYTSVTPVGWLVCPAMVIAFKITHKAWLPLEVLQECSCDMFISVQIIYTIMYISGY